MAFTLTSIPLGTLLPDGVRAGPQYTEVIDPLSPSNAAATNYYNRYGPGVLYSPIATYNIAPCQGGVGNIAGTAAGQSVAAAGYLTLTGDSAVNPNVASYSQRDARNNVFLQFDWPRTISVTVGSANMTALTPVTIFGTDYYGFPIQYTFSVDNIGTYGITLNDNCPAFYTVTAVYCNGTTGGGGNGTLSVQTSNIFGLPYHLKRPDAVLGFGWNSGDMMQQFGITGQMAGAPGQVTVTTPAVSQGAANNYPTILFARRELSGPPPGHVSVTAQTAVSRGNVGSFTLESTQAETSTFSWMIPDGGVNLLKVGDTSTPTGTTGDPRGVVKLPEALETWAAIPNGTRQLVFTYFVEGANAFINQLASGRKPYSAVQNVVYSPLTVTDLYGNKPFYTGNPV